MFWKSAILTLKRKFFPSAIGSWSITLRLAVIYAFTSFSLLALATLFLYWVFVNRLQLENEQFLQNKVLILQRMLQTQPYEVATAPSYRDEVILEPPVDHYFSRVVDKVGHVMIETPGMSDIVSSATFAQLMPTGVGAQHAAPITSTRWKHKYQGHSYHYLLVSAPADPALLTDKNQQFIQMAKDISTEHAIVENVQSSVVFILLFGIVISAVISIIVSRKNLKPLRDITTSAQRITVTQLKERLDPSSWPTELSALAIAFNHMLDRIEEGVARLSRFSADLAHELRTPINNLMGEAEIALSKPRSTEEYREALASNLEEFQRLSHMIENLLFLARAENPELTINRSWIDIAQLFRDVCDFYEAAAEEKQVAISYQGKGCIYAEPTLLRRAVTNLVSNALQHSVAGGSILLTAQTNAKQAVQISVSDTGKGIAAHHLPHLFDRLYRVDSDRSYHSGGAGLGLAIVKSIMDLHRGTVTIDSQVGEGTVVTLAFSGSREQVAGR